MIFTEHPWNWNHDFFNPFWNLIRKVRKVLNLNKNSKPEVLVQVLGSFGAQRLVEDMELEPASWSPLATASWCKKRTQRGEREWRKRVNYVRLGYRVDIPPQEKESLVPAWVPGGEVFSEFSLGGHGTPGSLTSDELRYVRVGSWQRHVGFRKGGPLK